MFKIICGLIQLLFFLVNMYRQQLLRYYYIILVILGSYLYCLMLNHTINNIDKACLCTKI